MAIYSVSLIFLFALLLGHDVVRLEASHHVNIKLQSDLSASSASKSQPYRTGYHFQPPKNWMNDPNGPMIYKGIYHLFYQYNPKGVVRGTMVWGHSTSRDLVNWTPHPVGIYPSQPSDINGTWSGSATFLKDGKPAILYTGINEHGQQVQNLALPKDLSDPYLIQWVKSPKNPLMSPTPENHIIPSSFRDPTTAWLGHDGKWRVIIGSKFNRKGMAILYTSEDFVDWVEAKHPLHSAEGTGMWECPDFYPVEISSPNGVDKYLNGKNLKHVLKASLHDTKHDVYSIGTYDPVKDVYTPDEGTVEGDSGLRYDYGKFYASKTFFDSVKRRRILWGWINESTSVNDDMNKGWSGIQAVPRTVLLDKSGKQLVQWPIKEIETLREKPGKLPNKVLKGGSVCKVSGITSAQADVEISFKVSDFSQAEAMDPSWTNPQLLCSIKDASAKGNLGPFGLLVLASKGRKEYTAVFFRIFRDHEHDKYVVLMCSDQSRSSLNNDKDKTTYGTFVKVDPSKEKLSLRSLIDHSIVESFAAEGKSCITARVYPLLATNENALLYAFNYGTQEVKIASFNAWSMKNASINREPEKSNFENKKLIREFSKWFILDSQGNLEVDEKEILYLIKSYELLPRDIRLLLPGFHTFSIIRREKAIVLNVEPMKCIITAQKVLVINDGNVLRYVEDLTTKLSTNSGVDMPLEFKVIDFVLEVALMQLDNKAARLKCEVEPLIVELKSKTNAASLGRLYHLKSQITELIEKVEQVRNMLQGLIHNHHNMTALIFEQWACIRILSVCLTPNSRTSYFLGQIEIVLEAYFVTADSTLEELKSLLVRIGEIEEYINIKETVDSGKINFLQFAMTIATFTFEILTNIFGINRNRAMKTAAVVFCLLGLFIQI